MKRDGSYRVHLGITTTIEMADEIDRARGGTDKTTWIRAAIRQALSAQLEDATDWERRARAAEDKLAVIHGLSE